MKRFFDIVGNALLVIAGILTGITWDRSIPVSIVAIVGGILFALYLGYALGVHSSTQADNKKEELDGP